MLPRLELEFRHDLVYGFRFIASPDHPEAFGAVAVHRVDRPQGLGWLGLFGAAGGMGTERTPYMQADYMQADCGCKLGVSLGNCLRSVLDTYWHGENCLERRKS